ncbi:hypothetical protein, partial [Bradyrhizobium sp. RT11b]|uniref:hypothetical protein n=1 Tax=Bradyrhizobium sp. RT11b TaxID=3156332 RepID=UPI0033994914
MTKVRSTGSAKRRQSVAPLPGLTIEQVVEVVGNTAKQFEETCNVAASYTSRSWWITGLARLLADQGLDVVTDVSNQTFRHPVGNFYVAVRSDFVMGIDLLACEKWSRCDLGHEEYGQDEEFLPAFHVVKIVCNQLSGWREFFDVANVVSGPLTVTVIGINVFAGGESYYQAAKKFESEMADLESFVKNWRRRPAQAVFRAGTVSKKARMMTRKS